MSTAWQRLFFRSEDQNQIVDVLVSAYSERGFKRFDPFPGGTGTPVGLKETYRHFVSPVQSGWVTVLGIPTADLSLPRSYLRGWLDGDTSGWDAYRDGHIDPAGLASYLQTGKTATDLATVQARPALGIVNATPEVNSTLPADVQKLARDRGVNPDQANKMIGRLTAQLFGKMDKQSGGEAGAMQQQAQAALNKAMSGPVKIDWNSAPARQLTALAALLIIPIDWREPDFEALREAYQVARRLARNPNASLLPDEKDSLAQVPNAGAYQPVYTGK